MSTPNEAAAPLEMEFVAMGTVDFTIYTGDFRMDGAKKPKIEDDDEDDDDDQSAASPDKKKILGGDEVKKEDGKTLEEEKATLRCTMSLQVTNGMDKEGKNWVKDIYGEFTAQDKTGGGLLTFVAKVLQMPKIKDMLPDISGIAYLSQVVYNSEADAKKEEASSGEEILYKKNTKAVIITLNESWIDKTVAPTNFVAVKQIEDKVKNQKFLGIEICLKNAKKGQEGRLLSVNNLINAFQKDGNAGADMQSAFELGIRISHIKYVKVGEIASTTTTALEDGIASPQKGALTKKSQPPVNSRYGLVIENGAHKLLQIYSLPDKRFFFQFDLKNLRGKDEKAEEVDVEGGDGLSDGVMAVRVKGAVEINARNCMVRYTKGKFNPTPLSDVPLTFFLDQKVLEFKANEMAKVSRPTLALI